ncbi:GATA zinc finger domain-containing protein 11-like [Topomyia yanbarensis]|uniref:GATA zinc finger domain-containing protein 11-like n=1 Tax=Topomyia yanbarensis TaxID=2498891 RepID=UPI00273BAAEE|nr:GATA zinc finger domain-containing protein 11-like [Topomyia yanbarensis]
MLTTRKPGPPVPPRPSAAAVATALAKHRENSPNLVGVHTLKPPHPGRTIVYKSPAFENDKTSQQIVSNGNYTTNTDVNHMSGNGTERSFQKSEIYVGLSNGYNVPRPIHPADSFANRCNNNINSNMENSKLTYTSTCSIIEINSSSSASTSSSSSPMSTLHKSDSKPCLAGVCNDHNHHLNSADEDDTVVSQKLNAFSHRLMGPLEETTIKRNSSDVIVINSTSSEHDSGTEQYSADTNSIASSNSLERENNFKNLGTRKAHMTEIIIGHGANSLSTNNNTTKVVTNGNATIIEARNDALLNCRSSSDSTNHVIRSSSICLPYRPEPEGGEHVTPLNDQNRGVKLIKRHVIDPKTIDSKLSEKKVAFHEQLISELTAMRVAHENTIDTVSRRQRYPPETRSSTDVSPNGTATRLARIRTSDWIEVGDNGKEVVLSSCQISLEDSGMEDEEKLDDASSGVGDSWDSVKDAEERITMSLPGLPPLPKSLSGFDLAGQQLLSHQQHHQQQHPLHQQQQQQHHHHVAQHQSSQHQPQQQKYHHHHAQHPPSQQLLPHQQLPPSLNHHPTNPFIPMGVNLQSVSMASLVSQRGQSPISTVSSSSSISVTPNSGSGGGGSASVRKPTTLDTQLAVLRREMYGLRQLDLSLLSQLWALNESIQEFRTMLQEQETLSPPSPTPSNSDANSVSSDEDEDESSNTATAGGIGPGHNLIESVAAASVLVSSQSSRMRAPPPPPPNRKAPSRPV